MKEIIIYGAGGFAKMMRLYLDRVAGQKVVAFCADQAYLGDAIYFDNLPLVSFEDVDKLYPADRFVMLVAVGYANMRARRSMYESAQKKGYSFVNYIDEHSVVDETVLIGENNVILSGSILEPFSCLGDNNIIWSSVTISHDVKIGSHCFIASQTLLGGSSSIEDNCFFGFNATCIQGSIIRKESLIGAKSLVLASTEEYSKNIGIPAKQVSCHRDKGIQVV